VPDAALRVKGLGAAADNQTVTVTMPFTPRVRALLVVLVLACAAVGAGLIVLGRSPSTGGASPLPTGPQTAAPKTLHRAAPVAPRVRPRSAAPQPATSESLPAPIREAFSAHRVVVVALFDPGAAIDGTALREASAGAQLAGTAFVPVDVTTNEVDSLNLRYGAIQDPAVLVLRPPGDLVVRIDGFADRDTVAQAAANAAS
jgi:hypothetical protein